MVIYLRQITDPSDANVKYKAYFMSPKGSLSILHAIIEIVVTGSIIDDPGLSPFKYKRILYVFGLELSM